MAIPRKDDTIAARVKKLEDEVGRIKLVPTLSQSAVEPLAVKGSGWYDTSAGNEPKVYDGTAWVPVRDETIAVAQTTADTAQATVDPLVPLTDLAAVTDGTTITGATNVTSDAGSGAHVVINDPAYPGQIALYSGNANEVDPGLIKPKLGGANYGVLELRSPDLVGGGEYCYVLLEGYDDGHTSNTTAADNLNLEGTNTKLDGYTNVRIGDGTDWITITGQAVTDADLSSLTNIFPTFPYYYGYLSANQSIASGGAGSTITGWVDDGTPNSSDIADPASGIFTVPTAGRYRLTVQGWWALIASPAGARTIQWVQVSPNVVLASHTMPPSALAATPTQIEKTVRLAAGAQIFVRVVQSQGAAVNLVGSGPDLTYAQIEWVGP